jgi:hypothetical protein
MKLKATATIFLLVFLFSMAAFAAEPVDVSTCEKYLKAMKIEPKKSGANQLTFKTGFSEGKDYKLLLVADPANNYVYMAVTELYKLPANAPKACEITKKMAAMNYGMLLAKLEWDIKAGEVRLSTTLTTEDGLSAKRFAAALVSLVTAAEQVEKKLK